MNNTMISIGKYIMANFAAFGLAAATDLKLIEKPKSTLTNGGKWLIMQALRTLPDNNSGVPFGKYLSMGVKGERFLTLIEFECKTRAPEPEKDFYWNTARQFRDKVYNALAGQGKIGLVIPRYDWTDPQNPVAAGEIWFKIDEIRGSPQEDEIEDPNDPANKSMFLTYHVYWWRPV
jgi:hypothetical protein